MSQTPMRRASGPVCQRGLVGLPAALTARSESVYGAPVVLVIVITSDVP